MKITSVIFSRNAVQFRLNGAPLVTPINFFQDWLANQKIIVPDEQGDFSKSWQDYLDVMLIGANFTAVENNLLSYLGLQ